MPRYKRYGYVVIQKQTYPGGILACTNIGFHLHPSKANEQVDNIIEAEKSGKVVADETVTRRDDMQPSVRRNVLIEHQDDRCTQLLVERWYVEVGRR